MSPPRQPIAERLWAGALADGTGCWVWQRGRRGGGYGTISHGGRQQSPHRLAYEIVKGPIPAGLEIDHLCRVRACINPDHLEAVTHRENQLRAESARKTHCIRGHPFNEANTRITRQGRRACRPCKALQMRAARQRAP